MLLKKIAEEIELLSQVEAWLAKSLSQPGRWRSKSDKPEHELGVRRFRGESIGTRYSSSSVGAEALASALGAELGRLAQSPELLRFALESCEWPEEFRREGEVLIEAIGGRTIDSF